MFWWGVAAGIVSTIALEAAAIIVAAARDRERVRRNQATVNPWI